MMRGGLSSRSRRSPHSDDAGDLGHQPSSTDAGRGGAAGSPLRSQHSPVVVASSSSTSTASLPPSTSTSTVNIPSEAFDSDSETQTETDSDNDDRRGYRRAVPRGPTLRVIRHGDGTFRCPVCPSLASRWTSLNEVRDHVVGKAKSRALREGNKKKYSRHRVLARNEGWML
ncbi:hypothetical protein PVAP13_2KG020832 [Panicum virgatum]|uniref:Uncharacterized protein n=1 Tax=Panicum virgatum TaxID=38727 RepID=A0A8T0VXE9_PANVG|nr:hypothetical protein PVAP13_2KG020832 [Panicum virgatum]